ncbi:hypothetical protein ACFVXG_20410 [Kitasatospora sp. NPDC058162]|uniref:hypothetical protein n=1 Tax=Kitasatospora sp. NPDC058162 TaxID=3346362 RepID=UPI0036D8DA8C
MTFADLIRRYADDVTYLASGLETSKAAADLTPEQFTDLVQEAVEELESLTHYGEADDLVEAAALLRAALAISGPSQHTLLTQAGRLLEAAEQGAKDIRLSI